MRLREDEMESEKTPRSGGISVESEHIFPIIKKWLYSEKEIFLRELVSNASDAITKLKRLSSLGQYQDNGEPYRIDVSFSAKDKTITVTDNGIGMTEEELERYICKVALSGALEFIQKYEGQGDGSATGIIGHFGLGFYSAFMVADTVEVVTRSYTDAPAVRWVCREDGSYEVFDDADGHGRGTSVILHVNGEGEEYLSKSRLSGILDKYCAFMPVEIYLSDEEEEKKEDGHEEPVNDPHPLWQKKASDCTDEEYKAFYRKVFGDYREPLFYLHLNADYPLNFKGILYFPKIREDFENLEGKIKLYYNQVFVADNIKEIIPSYLLMLRGVLDCPELPLNVSRSYLQNNAYVAKVSAYIVRKVADKITSLFQNEREHYEKLWDDLKTFVEYAALSDRKFYDRVHDALLFTLTDGSKVTVPEYLEQVKEKHEQTVFYTQDAKLQAQYIEMCKEQGIPVVRLEGIVDMRFAETMEQYESAAKLKFLRVDANPDLYAGGAGADAEGVLKDLFSKACGEGTELTVRTAQLQNESVPAILTVEEEARRMGDMMAMYAPDAPKMPQKASLTLNTASAVIRRLEDGSYGERAPRVAAAVYGLALLAQRKLEADELRRFLADSTELLAQL